MTTLSKTADLLRKWGHTLLIISPEDFRTFPCPTYNDIPLALFPGRKVRHLLDQFVPQAVHVATEGPLGWAARRYCLKKKIGFTTSYHTRFPEYIKLRAPIPLTLSYGVVRRFHASASRTMVVSDYLRNELQGRGFSNLAIWRRGVDLEQFMPRSKSFLQDPRPIAMFTGRVAVEKNIEAFLDLNINATKYVVGDGPARKELMARYPDVRFPGAKYGIELAQYMSGADVFVFPSLTDTFGVVMLEANACGLPIAAFPVTGPQQIVRNGVNGALDNDLAVAVKRALRLDPALCAAEARYYSWEFCTDQFLNNLYVNEPLLERESVVQIHAHASEKAL